MNTREIIDCAMAKIKADIIIRGGKYLNVYTKEILRGDIVTAKGKIVHIGDDTTDFEGNNTTIIKLNDEIVCPGLLTSTVIFASTDSCDCASTNMQYTNRAIIRLEKRQILIFIIYFLL